MTLVYEHEELKLLQELLLKLGLTLTLAVVLLGVYFFMARKRAKKVPTSFFVMFLFTLSLYIILIFNESELIHAVKLWHQAYLWAKFAAYLGTAYVLLKAADLLLLEDFFIAKKGAHIPALVRLLVLLGGLAVAVLVFLRTVLGIDVVALVAIPTAITAVIGFALQDTLKRFFAGLMLSKLVRVGQWVSVAGKEGRVVRVDLTHVTIITRDDDLVMVPNDLVAQLSIANYNKPTMNHARTVLVEAGYEAPPLQARTVLVEAAKAVPGVLHDPAPEATVSAYKDSGIEYRLRFWINDYRYALEMDGEVLTQIWYAFKRERIEIPLPQRIVHVTNAKESERAIANE